MSAAAAATQTATDPAGQAGATSASTASSAQGAATATTETAKTSLLGGTEDPKKADGQGTQSAESKDGKAPAASELEIKLPDGVKVEPAVLAEYQASFKEMGITDGALASKLVAADVARQTKMVEKQVETWSKQSDAWAEEVQKDKDFGGEKLAANVLLAKDTIRRYGGPVDAKGQNEVTRALSELGLENHPAIFRLLARIGAANKEDSSSTGSGGRAATTAKPTNTFDYPSMRQGAEGARS